MSKIIPEINYHDLFDAIITNYLIMTPDYKIVMVNDPYLKATNTTLESVIGKNWFEVFPNDPNSDSKRVGDLMKTAIDTVVKDKVCITMQEFRYNIPKPESNGGGFEERHWAPTYIPLLEKGEVKYVIHNVIDVTEDFFTDKDFLKKMFELQQLNSTMIGRELRMIELKEENAILKEDKLRGSGN